MATYTRADVDRIAEALRSLPVAERLKARLNKQELVAQLVAELIGVQERGYPYEQIAEHLQRLGLTIRTGTLKTYLGRTKKQGRRSGKRPAALADKRRQPVGSNACSSISSLSMKWGLVDNVERHGAAKTRGGKPPGLPHPESVEAGKSASAGAGVAVSPYPLRPGVGGRPRARALQNRLEPHRGGRKPRV